MQPLVSILIPVYNAEKFLRQCLDSVVSQTYKNLQIICINDASTDNSLSVIKEYAVQDSRLMLINKVHNGGYACAINAGLRQAQGDYIGFVEADDWVETDMFETLVQYAIHYPQADIIRGDFYHYTPSLSLDVPKHSISKKLSNRLLVPQKEQDVFKLERAIWSGIYKKEFLQKYHILLNETPMRSFQDTSFTIITWALAQYVYLCEKPLVHYRQDNPASSVRQRNHTFDIQEEFAYADAFLGKRAELFRGTINHLKLICYWWNIKRISLEAACEFIKVCAHEIRHVMYYEPLDSKGLSLRIWIRSWWWALSPTLLIKFWKWHQRQK